MKIKLSQDGFNKQDLTLTDIFNPFVGTFYFNIFDGQNQLIMQLFLLAVP